METVGRKDQAVLAPLRWMWAVSQTKLVALAKFVTWRPANVFPALIALKTRGFVSFAVRRWKTMIAVLEPPMRIAMKRQGSVAERRVLVTHAAVTSNAVP